jgi:hypothetical protein
MSEKEEKVEALRRLLIEGEESGFTDCTLEQIIRELDTEANHIGSDFDDFLREEGILPEVEAVVKKRLAEERWRKENAAAIDAYNEDLAKRSGPFASRKRRF